MVISVGVIQRTALVKQFRKYHCRLQKDMKRYRLKPDVKRVNSALVHILIPPIKFHSYCNPRWIEMQIFHFSNRFAFNHILLSTHKNPLS